TPLRTGQPVPHGPAVEMLAEQQGDVVQQVAEWHVARLLHDALSMRNGAQYGKWRAGLPPAPSRDRPGRDVGRRHELRSKLAAGSSRSSRATSRIWTPTPSSTRPTAACWVGAGWTEPSTAGPARGCWRPAGACPNCDPECAAPPEKRVPPPDSGSRRAT